MEDFPDVATLTDKALEEEQAWALHKAHKIRDKLPLSVEVGGYHERKRPAAREELERLEAYSSDLSAEIVRRGLVSLR